MNISEILISEALLHAELLPKVWDGTAMRKEVRDTLLQVAEDFLEGLREDSVSDRGIGKKPREVDIEALDVVLAGSLANYNYHKTSDVDLHMIVDMAKFGVDKRVVSEFFYDACSLWNEHHSIMIYGHKVEVYVQSKGDALYSNGLYSIMKQKWLRKPSRTEPDVDEAYVAKKAGILAKQIDRLISSIKSDPDKAYTKLMSLKDRLHNMRMRGLVTGGEFAPENLVYKQLRNDGHLQRLVAATRKAYDLSMTI